MAYKTFFLGFVVVLAVVRVHGAPFPGCVGGTLVGCPGTPNCTVESITQNIDHFNWAPPLGNAKKLTYTQRYFRNDQWWAKNKDGTRGPIFFYFGNEDNVELYVNHTGLMWESAEEFGALLIFAEHRYYGTSLPYDAGTKGCMSFLTSEQAMADFAYLIDNLRQQDGAAKSPIIGFGGSYGGMIGAWFRVHYPNAVDGVIAASAPIWSFTGLDPVYDPNTFDQIVTTDATIGTCASQLKSAWPKILGYGTTDSGRKFLQQQFRTCSPIRAKGVYNGTFHDDAMDIVQWAAGIWGTIAMGNYPYASSYLLHGKSLLPPWPVTTACLPLEFELTDDKALMNAVRESAAVMYNNTFDQECFNITGQMPAAPAARKKMISPTSLVTPEWKAAVSVEAGIELSPEEVEAQSNHGHLGVAVGEGYADGPEDCYGSWGYQWCTEMVQPFTEGTDKDMFYCPNGTYNPKQDCTKWDLAGSSQGCQDQWGVTPRPEWARVMLGGKRISDASNIVFSNGQLDPWHGGGILTNLSDSVVAIVIPNGAHHIDLMFTDPADKGYPDIPAARDFERGQMKKWVTETYERYGVEGLVPNV